MLRVALSILLLCCSARVLADNRVVDVAHELDGVALGPTAAYLEDATASLTIEDVSSRRDVVFRPTKGKGATPSFGITDSVYWVRFRVANTAARERPWLLEIAQPRLDYVVLYAPLAGGGYEAKRTGDTLPFRARDLPFYNFVFKQTESAHSERTYYLQVRSRSAVLIPLAAWTPRPFTRHQLLDWGVFCMFYGALLVMALHALSAHAFIGGRDNLLYAGYLLAVLASTFTLFGHTFQFLLPEHPAWVHRLTPLVIELAYAAAALMVREQMAMVGLRAPKLISASALALAVLVPMFPYELATKLVTLHTALLVPTALYACWSLAKQGAKDAAMFALSFFLPLTGVLVTTLHFSGKVESSGLTQWALQLGLLGQAVLVSANIADKLNTARDRLAAGNALHAQNIDALSAALQRANAASRAAEHAMNLRDRFMATISHEFRTPLNAIINIPGALREEFQPAPLLVCAGCAATFELEPGEVVGPDASCPACGLIGTLREHKKLQYVGDAVRARQLLMRVQLSGRRLLRTVNSILQFSRLKAKSAELACGPTAVAEMVRRSVLQTARHLQLSAETIQIEVPEQLTAWADEEKIEEVLTHLLDNAFKFARGPGSIRIGAEERATDCLFYVADHGIGIAAEDRERVFSEFEQVYEGERRRYGGTGLGLSICRALVEAHGGRIWVESTLDVGSTFYFTLPYPARQVARPSLVPT